MSSAWPTVSPQQQRPPLCSQGRPGAGPGPGFPPSSRPALLLSWPRAPAPAAFGPRLTLSLPQMCFWDVPWGSAEEGGGDQSLCTEAFALSSPFLIRDFPSTCDPTPKPQTFRRLH